MPKWIIPAMSALAGAGGEYAIADQAGSDPITKVTATGLGAVEGFSLSHGWKGPHGESGADIAKRMSLTKALPVVGSQMALGFMRNQNAQTNLANSNIAANKNPHPAAPPATVNVNVPPAPAPVTPPASKPVPAPPAAPAAPTDTKTTVGLSPGAAALGLGIGAMGAGGIWLLSKMLERNRHETVGAGGSSSAPMIGPDGEPAPGGGQPSQGLGTLRVSLPTRHKGDNETMIEMPLEQIKLPNTILNKIRRDTKRKLRYEGNERTHHISLHPPYEPTGFFDQPKAASLC